MLIRILFSLGFDQFAHWSSASFRLCRGESRSSVVPVVAKDNKLNSEAYINPTQARWVSACSKMFWLQLLPATSSCCFQLRISPKISMSAGDLCILWRDSPGFIRCSVNLKRFGSERAKKTRRLPTWTTAYVRGRLTSKISRCMGKSGMRWEYNSNCKKLEKHGKTYIPHNKHGKTLF